MFQRSNSYRTDWPGSCHCRCSGWEKSGKYRTAGHSQGFRTGRLFCNL